MRKEYDFSKAERRGPRKVDINKMECSVRMLRTLRKYQADDTSRRMGIVFGGSWRDPWAYWGFNHGAATWIPYWIRSIFVHQWNRLMCTIKCHETTEWDIQEEEDSSWPKDRPACCTNCSKVLTKELVSQAEAYWKKWWETHPHPNKGP
jgi:hypothetical protein